MGFLLPFSRLFLYVLVRNPAARAIFEIFLSKSVSNVAGCVASVPTGMPRAVR